MGLLRECEGDLEGSVNAQVISRAYSVNAKVICSCECAGDLEGLLHECEGDLEDSVNAQVISKAYSMNAKVISRAYSVNAKAISGPL